MTVSATTFGTPASELERLAPGLIVEVRDEQWLVTTVTSLKTADGEPAFRIQVRGVSDYVKDFDATFLSTLDRIKVVDPMAVQVVPDTSPHYRKSRIWVESTLRNTPIPLDQPELEVADRMLMDPLDYQKAAVHKTLGDLTIRPRILLADAVGLGKTLEIGMILSELVRRGRGERILIVTPRHVLEQFQQEMWTRFALPFVRLDSQGIQRVRQKLPASRNPFSYFPKVIVSMDTLKSDRYRAQLEKVTWDAVVIDEIHNATNAGTQNNQLARTLAPTTEALILASATPHNGDEESFKEVLRLLDPTAVHPDGTLNQDMVSRLIIRRHRHSPEVAREVGSDWAEREEPMNIPVDPSDEEIAVLRELDSTWTGKGIKPPCQDRLFPWTLMKAFLSSPVALAETINTRLKNTNIDATERRALERLAGLNGAIKPQHSNKLAALISYLQEIGVGPRKKQRAVVFSERVATLHWLQEMLVKYLKLPKRAVEVMHGGLDDVTQMERIDSFKREDSPIRVLVTGDVASEGVNLHAQCHDLIHFDIPWSLIRIQQRNGRIDRYGQRHNPRIASLLFDPSDADLPNDIHVLTRLVEREHAAHKVLGDVSGLMGRFSESKEENDIRDVLRGARDFSDVVADPEDPHAAEEDLIAELLGLAPSSTPAPVAEETQHATLDGEQAHHVSLYGEEIDFLTEALQEGFGDPGAGIDDGGESYRKHDNHTADLTPTEGLKRRLDLLPQDYLRDRQVKENLVLATARHEGMQQLEDARSGSSDTTWPKAHFLGPLHPVTTWAQQRALSSMERAEIPAVTSPDAEGLEVLFMGTLSNVAGQVVSRAFIKVSEGFVGPMPDVIASPVAYLRSRGLTAGAVNRGDTQVPENIGEFLRTAHPMVENALIPMENAAIAKAEERLARWHKRAELWKSSAADLPRLGANVRASRNAIFELDELVAQLKPERMMVRPILVITPPNAEYQD